ncbi:MAG TPA: hypothetical protein VIH88_08285 [Candidatus Acidoferrales bacterium]
MKENRKIELVFTEKLLKSPFDRKIKAEKSHPFSIGRVNRYPQRLHSRGVSLAICAAARNVQHFVALHAQLAQHLHPLHVRPVTIRVRQNFVDHQNVQRPLGCTAIVFG